MKGKPNLDSFLKGGAAAAAETSMHAVPSVDDTANEPRATKSIRITRTLDRKLKEEAYRRTMAGRRTSESDLIEEALVVYFNKQLNN